MFRANTKGYNMFYKPCLTFVALQIINNKIRVTLKARDLLLCMREFYRYILFTYENRKYVKRTERAVSFNTWKASQTKREKGKRLIIDSVIDLNSTKSNPNHK